MRRAAIAAVALLAPAAPANAQLADAPADVASYTLSATLAGDHRTIDGVATIRWVNTSANEATELWWHLYMNAFASDHSLFMRTGGGAGHRGHAPGGRGSIVVRTLTLADGTDLLATATTDPAVPDDATQLRTTLPRAVPPGSALELRATFRTVLPASFARTGYWQDLAFAGQWFPKLAVREADGRWAHFPFHANTEFYADFGRYEVTLDVPAGDVVGATGVEVSAPVRTLFRERHQFIAESVHDFAWTSWRGYELRDEVIGALRLHALYGPGMGGVAARALAAIRAAVPWFAARYGAYPYPQLTVVVPPPAAEGIEGMEYPTLITTTGFWWSPPGLHDAEYVAVHELAHQYFYGLFASDEWTWPALDEGFAEFASDEALAARFGRGRELSAVPGAELGAWAFEGAFAGALRERGAVARRADAFGSFDAYANFVYRRMASVLRTAAMLGDPARFDRALALYARRARFQHPTPDALLRAVDDEAGAEVAEGYLRPALFDDAALDYSVRRVDAHRAVLRREGGPALPVTVELEEDSGRRERRVWSAPPGESTLEFHGASPLRVARIAPDAAVPLDRDRSNDARLRAGLRGDNTPLAARLAWLLGLALRLLGP